MTFLFALFCVLFLIGVKFAPKKEYFDDHISLQKSNAIKGVFVVLVFLRHGAQYVSLDAGYEKVFYYINGCLGQMIVTLFLFFSGYGVLESIKKKGKVYVMDIPKHRVLKVWVHFCIALLPFLALQLAIGKKVTMKKFVLSMLCWEAIGNSSWYIMGIILSYLIAFVAFMVFDKDYKKAAILATILTAVTIAVLIPLRPSRYYNTLLCFPMGLWYSLYGRKWEAYLKEKQARYMFATAICMVICLITNYCRHVNVACYEMAAISFVGCILLLSMKICLDNLFLRFMGGHVFSIYILQRLPMLYFKRVINLTDNVYIFFGVSFVLTLIIAVLFDQAMKYVDKLLFSKKNVIQIN